MKLREDQRTAAATLLACQNALERIGATILDLATGDAGEIAPWRRYPEGEVYDPESHAQYFYHSHPPAASAGDSEPDEHGHFHLFLRAEGLPVGITPLLLPELAVANAPLPPQSAPVKRGSRDEVVHLVAIAIDRRGEPVRLFTTNRWVTGETWYQADDVIRMLDRFRVGCEAPSPLLNRWLTAIVQLFQPEIAVLLRNRDKSVAEWRWRRRTNVFEDPRLEITSSFAIDLAARLTAVENEHEAHYQVETRIWSRLPRTAEGWGR